MTTPTAPTGIVSPNLAALAAKNGNSGDTTTQNDQDKDMFLKLLIAQMKNQDPSNPTDSSQYLSQIAQFTQVEKLTDVSTALTSSLAMNQMTAAVSMIGTTVNYGVGDSAKSGVVTGVTVVDGTPQLLIGGKGIDLTTVTKVTPTDTSSTTSPTA